MVESLNQAATDYAEGMAKFLGVPEKDVSALKQRYKSGLKEFAKDLELQHQGKS